MAEIVSRVPAPAGLTGPSKSNANLAALDLVRLGPLMNRSSGRPEIVIGLLDGPVARSHPDLTQGSIREVPGGISAWCTRPDSPACAHGTFTAGILCAKRGSSAPAICPTCTFLVRPIFTEAENDRLPSAMPEELAAAIIEVVRAGARVLNLSLALVEASGKRVHELKEALDYGMSHGVIVVVAAGNQGTVGSSVITRHPWIIPAVACDLQSRPMTFSNLGHSIGRRGLMAPGENITSLGTQGKPMTSGGTSVAALFVTGTVALLWSEFPEARADSVRFAITQVVQRSRRVVPPLLDAWGAYRHMTTLQGRR